MLRHLSLMKEPPTQRELAQIVGVEGPTLARLLDSLESQRLVRRVTVPEDRRAKRVTLTEQARPLIEQIESIAAQMRDEMFSGIEDEDVRRCEEVHLKILANLTRS